MVETWRMLTKKKRYKEKEVKSDRLGKEEKKIVKNRGWKHKDGEEGEDAR